jgi:hypothetical protein
MAFMIGRIPLARFGTPWELAITGQVILVDGGVTASS